MKNWESWTYVEGLELLHPYKAGEDVTILDYAGNKTRPFKEWRGIISSCVDSMKTPKYRVFIQSPSLGDLVGLFYKDANPQILFCTFDEWQQLWKLFYGTL